MSRAGQAATPILAFDEIDSTNAEARRRAEAGEAGPLWITALRQTRGRGRRGRTWETGSGDLAATLLTRTHKPAGEAAQVAFVAALAASDLVGAYVPEELVALKWPNDVLVDGRKAAGVLVESGAVPYGGGLWLAIGVGVNLASAPAAAERPAAALADHLRPGLARPPAPAAALERLSQAFQARLSAWERDGFSTVRQAWTARAHGLGRPCTVRLEREAIVGVAEGLEADGALRLRLEDGQVRRITAGDVFFDGAP